MLRATSRGLHTTAARAVRRPQKPFETYIPRDLTGRTQIGVHKRQAAQQDQLYKLAHEGRASKAEKYAETYGLRVGATHKSAKAEDAERAQADERPVRPPDAAEEDMATLRRKAYQTSDVQLVLEKWRRGVDVRGGAYAVRAKEREEEGERARRLAERKAARREKKETWRAAKRQSTYSSLALYRAQHAEGVRLARLGFPAFRAKQMAKSRWVEEDGRAVILAADLRYLGGAEDSAMRERVWAAEKRAGRTAGPDPTPAQLGQDGSRRSG
ncbi:hypothetical protein CC85DRAFT_292023 [Cutaneotrichosporon oleaginosum]|uniref:Uncharacterized protein n=1 Tax=Cutaneotrichosporon oleaginosum TaxID=879819 RepID=A0A0J0XN15_9TREE|nr:uncharacterized protein CC85DRAFT_292023 [Cutaneotrichosporon oleaginosum]KLT42501.1 hypothetical protein CC85DRAFT_292023 [Cutaneotrichosporon oleaginosum]TXT07774.1 hypothetical protein COLE_04698 [Cutaneotrichosporon oleaginosum]